MNNILSLAANHWPFLLLLGIGIPATVIDIRQFRIPDYLTFTALPAGFMLHLWLSSQPWWIYLLHAAAGFAVFFVIRVVSRGKLGWGDVKYAACLSALLGFFKWLDSICIAVLLALLYYVFLGIKRKADKSTRIPFGPFMTGGAVLRYILDGIGLWTNGIY